MSETLEIPEVKNEVDNTPPSPEVKKPEVKRNTKGQYEPKTNGEKPPESTPEDATKRYFDKREADLYEHLKEITSPKELEDFDQLTRIKMMELLLKKSPTETVKKTVNPLAPQPPVEVKIPTLMERNRRDAYMNDLATKGSYVGMMDKLRKK